VIDNVRLNGVVGDTGSGAAAAAGTTTVTGTTAVAAPVSLTGYRNKVGQTFEFSVTGVSSGGVWRTDVYTDDSTIGRAAIHAGVIRVGETKVLTITILPGQATYSASTRNGDDHRVVGRLGAVRSRLPAAPARPARPPLCPPSPSPPPPSTSPAPSPTAARSC